jgi:outer membrane lipoprotein-sorting protein
LTILKARCWEQTGGPIRMRCTDVTIQQNHTAACAPIVPRLLFAVAVLGPACMGCQTQSTADFAMTIEAKSGNNSSIHRLVYASPNRWRTEVSHMPRGYGNAVTLNFTTLAVCDGRTVWSHMSLENQCRRWDVGAMVAESGAEQTFAFLRGVSLMVFSPGNPISTKWAEEFGPAAGWNVVRDEVHDGVQTTLVEYVKGKEKIHAWFGVEDGLMRQQIQFKANGEELLRFMATEVTLAPKVSTADFTFVPPKGMTVRDETADTIEVWRNKE